MLLFMKVVYAISCIVRNYPDAEIFFGKTYGYAIFQRAIISGIPSLATRAIFLANALITSDSSSEEMITLIAPAFLPGSFPFVTSPDINLREGTLLLLLSFAKTARGKALITSAAELGNAFQDRISAIVADPDFIEQEEHEQRLIEKFNEALIQPVCIPYLAPALRTETSSNVLNNDPKTLDDDCEVAEPIPEGPVLMLKAPQDST